MAYWNDVWKIINGEHTSVYRDDTTGRTMVNDTTNFKALNERKQQRVNDIVCNEQKTRTLRNVKTLVSYDEVKQRSAALIPLVVNNYKTDKPLTRSVQDAIMNMPTMTGVPGQDPSTVNWVAPNLWLSPGEAASIYSQQGIPGMIIRKKSQSVLLNGVKIKNPRLSASQIDTIQEDMIRNGLPNKIADCLRDSLVYGGALLFPMFKKDTPISMNLPVEALMRYGIVGKGCIDWMVSLDRWNTVHIPNWNPTAKDFLFPQQYYVPFLGCDVSGQRCARIVTAPQAGYWGVLMTMGWGISDIPGWLPSILNYHNVMQAIPTMIAQMSILARTINVDGIVAMEGGLMLEELIRQNTVRVRELSVNNPITMDVIGTIQAIQRDFKEVPNLVRLIRQDAAARAGIPEELFWSSERGAFASGDSTEGALEKQWESVKYIHRDAAFQLKNIAMLEVVNALGIGREVLSALPYTTIEFDNPIVANAEIRAKIAESLGKCAFDLVAAGIPADAAMQIVSSYGDDEFSVRSDLLDDLKKRQEQIDTREKEKHDREMELLEAQVELMNEQADHVGDPAAGTGGAKPAGKKPVASDGYSRLEQHKKERTRGTASRREGLQKANAKKVGL
jgi:hypothetical protein